MPIYEYQCAKCGDRAENFVWHISGQEVKCKKCGGVMARLFTVSNLPLLNRQKPRPYRYDFRKCSATEDAFESCKRDYEKGRTGTKEVEYWKKAVEEENPNLIV